MRRLILGVALSLCLSVSCSQRRAAARPQPPPTPAPVEEHLESDAYQEAAEFFRFKRWQGEGEIPMERYLAARRHARGLPLYSLAGNAFVNPSGAKQREATFGTWQALGPGNIGGRVRSVAIDPVHPNIIYAAAATGGVWKSTDAGQSWSPLTDLLPVLSVSSLVMDPSDPNTLYAGTGEDTRGAGIFKSSDAGQTWTQLPQTATSSFYHVTALAISPARPTNLYAATDSGLFFTTDSGVTWTKALPKGAAGFFSCYSVAVRSDKPADIVFAACGQFNSNGLNFTIYRSNDPAGGAAWDPVLTDPKMESTAIAVSPSNPDTVYAIAVTNDAKSPFRAALLGVYRSTQGGDSGTWDVRARTTDANSIAANILSYPSCTFTPDDHHGQGGYNLAIAVDPTASDVVFVAGIDLFRSDDGGATWGYADGGQSNYAHSDQHFLAFHPQYDGKTNQTLFVGNDGGVYRTDAARGALATGAQAFCGSNKSQIGWTSLNNGFAATQFYHGAVFPGGAAYFGGTQDNGTPLGTDAQGANKWIPVYGGDGGAVAVDPLDPNTMFYEYINLSIRKSEDGALSSSTAISGITEDAKNNFQFINYFTFDPADSLKMYTGGTQLWRSLDAGDHWTAASAPTTLNQGQKDIISTIAVDPADGNHILFGTGRGRIYRSTAALRADGNTTWASSQPSAGFCSRIAFDPNHRGVVYATYSTFRGSATPSQIFRSDDNGVNWIPIGNSGAGALADAPVHVLLVDPDNSSTLYAGTDIGVFASFDAGASWVRDDTPFADADTETLAIEKNGSSKFLYAFTYGRGVWRVNLSGDAPSCTYSVSTGTIPADANGGLGSLDVSTGTDCSWSARPGKSFVSIQSPARGKGPGKVFYKIKFNGSRTARSEVFYVQNIPVTVNQSGDAAGAHGGFNDEITSAKTVSGLPYTDSAVNQLFSENASDPIHSCTGSADLRTQWWKYTADKAGRIFVNVTGRGYSFYGNAGIAISAYPLTGNTPGNEAACATAPRNTSDPAAVSIQFDVAAGRTYAIEVSALSTQTAFVDMEISVFPSVALTPGALTLGAGKTQQFTANLTNTPNTAVRWSVIPPLGAITSTGLYTAPALLDASATVNVMARSFANPAASALATVTLQPPPVSFSAASITNAASFQNGPIAPGEVITIFGVSLGPLDLAGLQLDAGGRVATTLGGTQALFDGVPAPLIYTSTGQLSAIVPYAVANKKTTQVQVSRNGQKSTPVTVPVADAAPALFTANTSGSGPAAMLNQDGLINSAQFAAPRGSVVLLFGTGEGQTLPGGVDGQVASSVFPKPVLPITVQIGGKPAEVVYAGAAPSLVAGVLQINARIPMDVAPGAAPVIVTAGNAASRPDVTINVLGPDGRTGRVAYSNTGSTPVNVFVYKPDNPNAAIPLGAVPGGRNVIVGTTVVENDWGISVDNSPVRVISHVCALSSGSPPYWQCTGSAAKPFPR